MTRFEAEKLIRVFANINREMIVLGQLLQEAAEGFAAEDEINSALDAQQQTGMDNGEHQ